MSSGLVLRVLQNLRQIVALVGRRRAPPAYRRWTNPAPRCCPADPRESDPSPAPHRHIFRAASSARRCAAKRTADAPAPTAGPASFAKSSGGISYFERHIAPVSLNPSSCAPFSKAPRSARNPCASAAKCACQPCQASSSSSGLVLVAMIAVMSSTSRHGWSLFFDVRAILALAVRAVERSRQPRDLAALRGSAGVASTRPIFSSFIFRAMSGGS